MEAYFCTTPYVDAYSNHYKYNHRTNSIEEHPIDFFTFDLKMRQQAYSWGFEGVGRCYVNNKKLPMDDEGRIVLAIGRFGDRQYAYVVTPGATDEGDQLIEFDWPYEWDVT